VKKSIFDYHYNALDGSTFDLVSDYKIFGGISGVARDGLRGFGSGLHSKNWKRTPGAYSEFFLYGRQNLGGAFFLKILAN